MSALAFLTIFLSLVSGPQWVEVTVLDGATIDGGGAQGAVARVELRLDGQTVAVREEAPWGSEVDFGKDLLPHHLEAVAFDSEGREVQRVEQWINLPRGRSALSVVVEESEGGERHVRLLWASVDRQPPDEITITYDGVPLELVPGTVLSLPPAAEDEPPGSVHLLAAELRFGGEVVRSEVALGADFGSTSSSELTALPVILPQPLPADGEGSPAAAVASRWVAHRDGEPLRVSAVEAAAADLVLIHDRDPVLVRSMRTVGGVTQLLQRLREGFALSGVRVGDRLRLVLPGAPPKGAEADSERELPASFFPITRDLGNLAGGLTQLVVNPMRFESDLEDRLDDSPQRLSDALAVSGLAATSGGRRRVVVLVANQGSPDASAYGPAQALALLEALRVPVVVWDPQGGTFGPWGPARDISTAPKLSTAVQELRRDLDRQAILWVEGRHLPQDLVLTAEGQEAGIALAVTSPSKVSDLSRERSAESAGVEPGVLAQAGDLTEPGEVPPGESQSLDPRVSEPEDASALDLAAAFGDFVDVSWITLDVFVRDSEDQPITDLQAEDFRVEIDGEVVPLTSFEAPRAASLPTPGAGDTSLAGDDRGAEADLADELSLVVLSDLRQALPGLRQRLVEGLGEVLASEELPARVMVLGHDRRVEQIQPFTRRRDDLLRAISALEERVQPNVTEGERARLLNRMALVSSQIELARRRNDPVDIAIAHADRDALLLEMEAYATQQNQQGEATLAELQGLVRSLGALPGRKALLYIGDRLGLQPASEHLAALEFLDLSDFEIGRLESRLRVQSLESEIEALARQASAQELLLYVLSAGSRGDTSLDVAMASGSSSPLLRTRVRSARDADARAGACLPSDTTGGRCQVGGAEPSLLLQRALEDLDSGYSLAFAAPEGASGESLPVKVRVSRERVEVRHRKRVVVPEADQQLLSRIEAALSFRAESNPLEAFVAGYPQIEVAEDDLLRVTFDLRVPLRNLTLLPAADGELLQGNLRLMVLHQDDLGRRGELQRYDLPLSLPAQELRDRPQGLFAQPLVLTLSPGQHDVVLALWDEVARTGSFLVYPLALSSAQDVSSQDGSR